MTERDLELLSAYLDSTLDDDGRAALEARLTADEALRRELDALRETKSLIAALPQLRAPRPLTLTADQIRGAPRSRRTVLLSPWISIASAAAAFMLVAAGILSLTSGTASPSPSQVAALPTGSPDLFQAAAPTLAVPPAQDTTTTLTFDPGLALAEPVTIPPMATQAPPSEASRSDAFAPPTFTPTSDGAANTALESAPAGGFTTDPQTPGTFESSESAAAVAASGLAAETPVLDLLADAATSAPVALTVLPELAAGASVASPGGDSGTNADMTMGTVLQLPSTPTALADAATLTTTPAPTQTPPSTMILAEEPVNDSPLVERDTQVFRDPMGVALVVLGMLLLFVAVVTTLLRMRR